MKLTKEEILFRLAQSCKGTLMETLDITYTDVGEDFLVAQMPVTPKVHQPEGVSVSYTHLTLPTKRIV